MKKKLQIERDRLVTVADDAALDEDIRRVGRRTVALEQRILEMRRTLQEQIDKGVRRIFMYVCMYVCILMHRYLAPDIDLCDSIYFVRMLNFC